LYWQTHGKGKSKSRKKFLTGAGKGGLGVYFLSIIGLTKGEGKANNHSNHPDE
jgi:hypothetical protein